MLGWAPSVDFDGLVGMMVDSDIERLSGIKPAKGPGRGSL